MSLKNKRVLITCGPTWAKIDDVRVVSNISSGEMGHLFADALVRSKARVTLLEGAVTHCWSNSKVKRIAYRFFDEIQKKLKQELETKKYDYVIHSAAISDFQMKRSFKAKINSEVKQLCLDLKPTPKLISKIKQWDSQVILVGFKLEPNMTSAKALKESKGLIEKSDCDFVVANSIEGSKYKGFVVQASGKISKTLSSKKNVVSEVVKQLDLVSK